MKETLSALFEDEKFDSALSYFREQDMFILSDLDSFCFEDLLFVPGVTKELMAEIKDRVLHELSTQQERTPAIANADALTQAADINHDTGKHVAEYAERKVSILDVYADIPRSAPFMKKCAADGKKYMDELTPEDFDNAHHLKGLGSTSAERLRSVYIDFTSSPTSYINGHRHADFSELFLSSLSQRARNCLNRAGIHTLENLVALDLDDLWNIPSLGQKTYSEIKTFRESLSHETIESIKNQTYRLENIDSHNKRIPIALLSNVGLAENDIKALRNRGFHCVGDLSDCELTPNMYSIVRRFSNFLSIAAIDHFIGKFNSLNENGKVCITRRANGDTLQEIGDGLGLTRERVRQIVLKACQKLRGLAELVVASLFPEDGNTLPFEALIMAFQKEDVALCCRLALQDSDHILYFKFADKFVYTNVKAKEIEEQLAGLATKIIGDGANFYDHLETIEEELRSGGLDFFGFKDMMNYLVNKGYRFCGDFVSKGKPIYGKVCFDAVCKYFNFDIKLDSDDDNEDMQRLRKIIKTHYSGLTLPDNNRALTAGMTRDYRKLILSGRGRYCPIEKVVYNISLFDELLSFIQNRDQSTFYYSELFSAFQEHFLEETNIGNHHFFHGMMKFLFPDEFRYERDLLVKNGSVRQNADDRIEKLLLTHGDFMTKEEIRAEIPGINDFVITFSVMRLPGVIQWGYNQFIHVRNIHIEDSTLCRLRDCIKELTDANCGYTSDELLFNSAKKDCPELFSENIIKNAQNLYYVASYLLRNEYRFRRPHIVSKDFPVKELSMSNIARALLGNKEEIDFIEYNALAERFRWADGTKYVVFSDLEKDCIRISENCYIKRDGFTLSERNLERISHALFELLQPSGYCSFSNIFDYDTFPDIGYHWNGFLLESLIKEYDLGFRVIAPQVRDRRYQRGIIVSDESSWQTFNDLVLAVLVKNRVTSISEVALEKLLIMHGIINKSLPQDIYDCSKMTFKNELFTLV